MNFGIAEAGQLNIANRDRLIERELCKKVEDANDKARTTVHKKLRKKFLGVF